MAMKRATVFENGSSTNGKVLAISETYAEFLNVIQTAFENPSLSVIYTTKGGRISDVSVIRCVSMYLAYQQV